MQNLPSGQVAQPGLTHSLIPKPRLLAARLQRTEMQQDHLSPEQSPKEAPGVLLIPATHLAAQERGIQGLSSLLSERKVTGQAELGENTLSLQEKPRALKEGHTRDQP